MVRKIMVIDDEPNMLALFERMIAGDGYKVVGLTSGLQGLDKLKEESFDTIFCDLQLDDIDGLEVLRRVKAIDKHIPFVIITAFGTIESAVKAIKQGAFDYLTKPLQKEEVKILLEKALRQADLYVEMQNLRSQVDGQYNFQSILSKSKKMRDIFRLAQRVADSRSSILIQGENGVGKELLARTIHNISKRKDNRFSVVNCSVMPDQLLEVELFGRIVQRGEGEYDEQIGALTEATGGSIYLEEINGMSMSLQSKLAACIENDEFIPINGSTPRKLDIRFIASSSENLKLLQETGSFLNDLFFKLAVIPIHIPPLRDRKEDIPLLVNNFIKKFCKRNELEEKSIAPEALSFLMDYHWNGNIRELENVIERAVLISDGEFITLDSLPLEVYSGTLEVPEVDTLQSLKALKKKTVKIVERETILDALRRTKGNRTKAALVLGISRGSLYNKMREYNIEQK